MAKKNLVDISFLSQAMQDEIISKKDAKATERAAYYAGMARKDLDYYYKLKDQLAAELLKKLAAPGHDGYGLTDKATASAGADKPVWSASKVLKIIANMPTRKPTTDAGYIKAVSNIENGKKTQLAITKAKAKRAAQKVKAEQAVQRKMFKNPVSARKAAADAKKAAAPKKKASSKK